MVNEKGLSLTGPDGLLKHFGSPGIVEGSLCCFPVGSSGPVVDW